MICWAGPAPEYQAALLPIGKCQRRTQNILERQWTKPELNYEREDPIVAQPSTTGPSYLVCNIHTNPTSVVPDYRL